MQEELLYNYKVVFKHVVVCESLMECWCFWTTFCYYCLVYTRCMWHYRHDVYNMKILCNSNVSKPHSKLNVSKFYGMNVINTITIMNKTISTFVSIHAPLICKHDPIPNPSLPIYQLIQHITKKITIVNLNVKKLDCSPIGFYKRV